MPRHVTSIFAIRGECTGKRRSTPTPDAIRRTVNVADARPLTADDYALEHLNALTRTLDDACMNADRVAGCKLRNIGAKLLLLQDLDDIHMFSSFDRTFIAGPCRPADHPHTYPVNIAQDAVQRKKNFAKNMKIL